MGSTKMVPSPAFPELLNHENYEHWSLRIETYLLAEDLWDIVKPKDTAIPQPEDGEEYKNWTRKNANALHVIQNSCGSDMFSFISKIRTAKDAWDTLEKECKAAMSAKVIKQKAEEDALEFERYKPFANYVIDGDWEKTKEFLIELPDAVTVRDPRHGYGDTALHLAARSGHAHIVKELLLVMRKEDVQIKNNNGSTAIHAAVKKGHVDIVKQLVPLIGEVTDHHGYTALHFAVQMRDAHTVKELVKLMRREDLEIKNEDGYTALHLAVKNKDVPIVKELLPYDDFDRYILLTNSVTEGDWSTAKECLRELDPHDAVRARDPRDGHGNTALHIAARQGHVDVVKELVLLMTKEDLELKSTDTLEDENVGLSEGMVIEMAKHMVIHNEKILSTNLELRNTIGDTALHEAVKKGHVHIVKELVPFMREKGFEVRNNEGATALHQAVLTENVDLVKMLVSSMRQVGLELRNKEGHTALHQAVMKGNVDIVKELVSSMRQEGFEVKSSKGYTALHQAVLKENVDIVKKLVSLMRQEGLRVKDAIGSTALHLAATNGNLDVVKELVSLMRQEGFEVKDTSGSTALHKAVMKGHMHIAKELVSLMRPEALEKKDGKGYTALGRVVEVLHDGDVKEMAKCMAEKNKKIFGIRMPRQYSIPAVWACMWSKMELGRYLYSLTPTEAMNGSNGAYLISICIKRMKGLDIAWDLLQRYPRLAVHEVHEPMFVLARMHYAFLSGTRLTFWQKWIYNRIHVQLDPAKLNADAILINFLYFEDDQGIHRKGHISSVKSFFISSVKGLLKPLGISRIYQMKMVHGQISEFLRCMGEATKNYNLKVAEFDIVTKSIFKAVETGHVEFVTQICKANPKLAKTLDEKTRSIYHFAIECRQEKIYSLIYGITKEARKRTGRSVDNVNNNMLHAAGILSPLSQLDHLQGATLQMQRELQWFKEVESVVPFDKYECLNQTDKLTARELFTKNHKKLMDEAEISIKHMATSCTVVGALIATMMFAAAFTIPGGNNSNTGIPMFIDERLFLTFIVSDALSLVSSTTSVIIFLGLLTSRYAEDDFLKSLPKKIMIGLSTLFISIATMVTAFSSALVIMLHENYSWIVIPSIILVSVPIISFVWVQFPLLLGTLISTYGPGIFDKDVQPWF